MPIYDQTYRHLEQRQAPARLRFLPIAASGLRLFFARKRFKFIGLGALAPFALGLFLICVPHYLPQLMDGPLRELKGMLHVTPETTQLFLANRMAGFFRIVFILFAGGGLIANDLRANALEIYFSRPITRIDYLLGKLMVLMSILLMLTLVPALILWLLDVVLASEAGFLTRQLALLPRMVGASLVLTLPPALLMLALSALARSARGAMILFAAVSLVTPVIGEKLASNLDDGRFELIDLTAAPLRLAAHLLGVDPAATIGPMQLSVPLAEVRPEWALAAVCVVIGLAVVILWGRVRPVEVVAG